MVKARSGGGLLRAFDALNPEGKDELQCCGLEPKSTLKGGYLIQVSAMEIPVEDI